LLDEIGDLSEAFQVRLLRVLQEKTYQPLGGTKQVKADVRIITATNHDLEDLVESGRFRRDLFYRIHVVRLDLPPLRERKEDIPMLVKHFISRFNRLRERPIKELSQEALSLLMFYNYPGNIRELENIIEHASVLCSKAQIEIHCLPENLRFSVSTPLTQTSITAVTQSAEARVILEVLKRNHYNRLATARELGIHKSTLYRKMKRLGFELPVANGRSRSNCLEQ
jgi:transcriptional regulator with PAS, ATPase and Fis domain